MVGCIVGGRKKTRRGTRRWKHLKDLGHKRHTPTVSTWKRWSGGTEMFYVPFQHLVGENDGETQRGTHVREDEGWKNGCPATVCASPMPMYHAVFIIHTQLWCSLLLLGLASHHSLTHSLVLFFFFFVHKLVCTRMFRLVCVLQQQVSLEMTCMAVKEGQEWQKSTCTGVNEHLWHQRFKQSNNLNQTFF